MKTAKIERGYAPKLFTWKDLEKILNNQEMVRMHQLMIPDVMPMSPFRPPSVVKKYIDNNVCYIKEMSRCTEKVNALAKKIEEEEDCPADAHIYFQRCDVKHPFGIHYDVNDNVIVQCQGSANFKVWEKVLMPEEPGLTNNLRMKEDPIIDEVLEPGDAVWIPRDYPHFVSPVSPKRLSISFCLFKGAKYVDREWIKL